MYLRSSSGHNASKGILAWSKCMLSHFSRVQLSATPWIAAHQAPQPMGFSRQEYWSGVPFPSPVIKYEVSEVREVKLLSRVRLCATPRTAAHQAPLSTGFSRQEYWSELPLPSPRESLEQSIFWMCLNILRGYQGSIKNKEL